MQLSGDVLVVMAKYPQVGQVKTRPAAVLGASAARDVYKPFLLEIHDRFAALGPTLMWEVDPPGGDFAVIVGGDCLRIDQRGADLAEAACVVMIGADVPHFPVDTVRAASTGCRAPTSRWFRARTAGRKT